METLKLFMAGLTAEEKKAFAEKCGTTINYLRKVMSTGGNIGPEICVQIELHSGNKVSRKDLYAGDWKRIWPELEETTTAA